MRAVCLRCGIDVSEYGRVCRDCIGVDPKFSNDLREQAEQRIAAAKRADAALRGMTFVGTTARTRDRRRVR